MNTEEKEQLSEVVKFAAYKIMEMRQSNLTKVDVKEIVEDGDFPDIRDSLLEMIDSAFTEKICWRKRSKVRACIDFAHRKAFEYVHNDLV